MRRIFYILFTATLIGCSQEEICIDADLVLINSKIYTGPVILEKYDYILARSFDHSGRGGLTIKIKQNGNN